MAERQAVIRVRREYQKVTFQIEGWATMKHSLAFRKLAGQYVAEGTPVIRVDLRECVYMDSTFLGDLMLLKREVDRRGWGEFALVSPSSKCEQLLQQMTLDHFFPVVAEEEPVNKDCTILHIKSDEPEEFQRNVVEAHVELANLEGPAGEQFRTVARCMLQDEDAKRKQQQKAVSPG